MNYKAIDSRIKSAVREDYRRARLLETEAEADPYLQFAKWFEDALALGVTVPNAMTVATADADGAPDARVVLLKGFDADPAQAGFVFYTNYESRKGRELTANPRATLLFFWPEMERQIRIEGAVSKVPETQSDDYFTSRPLGARLSAIASPQSQVVANRAVLEARLAEVTARHGDAAPRPAHWGGYRVTPHAMEFWQGRPDRLHDRLRYRKEGGTWMIERLAP